MLRALVRPKGMTDHSYKSYFVLKAVFHSSVSFILIWWYSLFRSILENTQDSYNFSSILSSLGMDYRYFIIMLLMAWQSTHILHIPSFLGINKTRTTHGFMFSLMYTFSINSLTYLWSSLVSSELLLQAGLFGMVAPDTKSIWWSILQIGGKSCGASLRKTSSYSCKREVIELGKVVSNSLVFKNVSLYKSIVIDWCENNVFFISLTLE